MVYENSIIKFIEAHRFHTMGPCNMFYKSVNGKYICADERTAFLGGVEGYQQIVNKTDRDLVWAKYSDQYKKNEQLALHQSQAILKVEEGININRQPANLLSLKKGILNTNGCPSGVFVMVFLIEEMPFWELSKTLDFINTSLCLHSETLATKALIHFPLKPIREQLTRREKDCAQYLCLGMSAREIAIRLNLSKRTVEYYITNMKDKLLVSSKSELVMKLVDLHPIN